MSVMQFFIAVWINTIGVNKFEGEWQAQVFLHYVDANGEHTDQKFDGRESLGLPKDMVQNLSDYWCVT
jgi:hypothetical protein